MATGLIKSSGNPSCFRIEFKRQTCRSLKKNSNTTAIFAVEAKMDKYDWSKKKGKKKKLFFHK